MYPNVEAEKARNKVTLAIIMPMLYYINQKNRPEI